MSDKKETTDLVEIPKTNLQKWEIAEIVDEAIAMGTTSEYMKNEYMYEFKQGNQIVRDLTASMYKHLALVEGVRIDKDETRFEIEDGWMECRVLAQFTHPITGEVHDAEGFGSRELPNKSAHGYAQVRKFIKQTTYSIAVRNAVKALLPFDTVVGAINALAEGTADGRIPTAKYKQPQQQQAALSDREKALKSCFKVYSSVEHDIQKQGVGFDDFWFGVKAHFKVEAKDDITAEQWKQLEADLADFGSITQDIIDKVASEDVEDAEVVEEDEETESDAPVDDGGSGFHERVAEVESGQRDSEASSDDGDDIPF